MRATGLLVVCGVVSSFGLACGSGGAPASAPPPDSAAALGAGAVTVYGDALAPGWVDWSQRSTRNFANASPVAAGTSSLALTLQGWGILSLHDGAGTVSGMASLVLSVNGGAAGGGDLSAGVTWQGTTSTEVKLAQYCAGGVIPANAWTRCTVPLSAMGAAGRALDGVTLRDTTGLARPTLYLDDLGFVPPLPAAPTGLTATAGTAGVSLAWSAVPGATGYDVYRATASGGPFTRLTASPQTATAYADSAVAAGSAYWYQVRAVNAAGAGPASGTVTATVPGSAGAGGGTGGTGGTPPAAVVVYGDALAPGWVDWSQRSTRSFANASPVASGTSSVAVTLQGWGILSLHDGAGSVSGMTSLVLSVNGGTAAGSNLNVGVTWQGTSAEVTLAQYCAGGVIPANAWTRCTVPLSALGATGRALDGITLRDTTGVARPTFYLDDLGFSGSGTAPTPPAAPTGLTATAAAGRISLAWSAVAGATGYDVYRAPAGGAFAKLTASPQAATAYADTAVTAGATYAYQVRALNAAGAGPASATVTATAPAAPPPAQTVAVTVSPAAATIDGCSSVRLTPTVTGTSQTSVTWSVQEGAGAGTVDASGNFTAANVVGTVHVVATSTVPPNPTATATLTVQQHVLSVAVVPHTAAVAAGGQAQLAATVTTTCGTFPAQ